MSSKELLLLVPFTYQLLTAFFTQRESQSPCGPVSSERFDKGQVKNFLFWLAISLILLSTSLPPYLPPPTSLSFTPVQVAYVKFMVIAVNRPSLTSTSSNEEDSGSRSGSTAVKHSQLSAQARPSQPASGMSARRRNVDGSAVSPPSRQATSGGSSSPDTAGLMGEEYPRDYVLATGDPNEDADLALGPLIPGSLDQRLTLMDEIVLLGLKDQKGYLSFLNDSISYVLRGCIIMELALRRRIRVLREPGGQRLPFNERPIEVVDASGTGEVLLDEALRLMKNERNSMGAWLDLLSGETWNPLKIGYQLKQVRERVAKGLVDKGVLRTEKHSFLLFDMATHPLASAPCKEAVLRRTMETCLGRGPMPSLRAIALVTAALTANVLEGALSNLPFGEREKAFGRAEELLRIYSTPVERGGVPLPTANEIIAGVLTVFSRLDSLIY